VLHSNILSLATLTNQRNNQHSLCILQSGIKKKEKNIYIKNNQLIIAKVLN